MTSARPRVLHLAYEDPRKPGSGGGAVRTREIGRRLSEQFEVTMVCATFPGCAPYEEDGVRYRHIGTGGPGNRSYTASVLSYFARQRAAIRAWAPDLVVEDFGAPLSTFGLPAFTGVPVIGVVQWLFAQEKARQYHLPVDRVERFGVARHTRLIAMSDDLADRLRDLAPAAQVDVVGNGLPSAAFETPLSTGGGGLRYLGRLEDAQKGVSLLLEAYAGVAERLPQRLLLAGVGPDEAELRSQAARLGIADRVEFVGPIAHEARFEWLAAADAVVMPSRYETFGMVAAEALAVGVPVIAFDIACLRGLVNDRNGRRVPAFDTGAFGAAMTAVATDPGLRSHLAGAARPSVRHLTWDAAAAAQADLYTAALRQTAGSRRTRRLAGQGSSRP